MATRGLWAAVIAAALTLTGCAGGGPSDTDVAAVRTELEALAPDWTVTSVSNDRTESRGWDHYLGVLVTYKARLTEDALLDLFEAITRALPESFRWRVNITIYFGDDYRPVDLTRVATALDLDPSKATFYGNGGIPTTVEELLRILEENGR